MNARRHLAVRLALGAALAIAAAGCARRSPADDRTGEEDIFEEDPFAAEERPAPPLPDPFEKTNRAFFRFNDRLYFWVLKPVATGYAWVVPQPARVSAANLFKNLAMPRRVLSALLAGDLARSGHELARFGVNTTWGILGLFDPANHRLGLKPWKCDFGHTFAAWGMGPGMYSDLPILGPSCTRDTVALPFNLVTDPIVFIPGVGLISRVNYISLHKDDYEDFVESAMDPYIAIRDAYNQNRHYEIQTRGR